jgi:uncharacterized membrane protein
MAAKASIAGHPIHPMLVPIPIGLFAFTLIADLATRFGWSGSAWPDVAFYCMGGGIGGALVAAVFGYLDYRSLTDPQVGKLANTHRLVVLGAVVLFIINFWLRWKGGDATQTLPLVLTLAGILVLLVGGWLGGHLVFVHGVAVNQTNRAR